MNPLLIQKLIADIINEKILFNWEFYALIFLVSGLNAVAGAYIRRYSSKRGEVAATKADAQEIIKHLKQTTATTKEIELSLSHMDWVQKEENLLKRTKLEQLIIAAFAIASWTS